jgi:hypothetical protein
VVYNSLINAWWTINNPSPLPVEIACHKWSVHHCKTVHRPGTSDKLLRNYLYFVDVQSIFIQFASQLALTIREVKNRTRVWPHLWCFLTCKKGQIITADCSRSLNWNTDLALPLNTDILTLSRLMSFSFLNKICRKTPL